MTLRTFALAAVAAFGLAATAHAAPPAPQAVTPVKGMNYDCTKAGNKNKAACKAVTPAGVTATKPVAAVPAATTPAPAAKPMNYDCTKAGNKNKAVCKNVVVPPVAAAKPSAPIAPVAVAKPAAPAMAAKPATAMAAAPKTKAAAPVNPNLVAATQKNGKVVHYDCSKAGNKDKTACKAA